MYSTTQTKLSLADWARIAGIHPLHFGGVEYTPSNRSPAFCDGAVQQHDWQAADRVSREQIAIAVSEAEEQMERHLGFRLAPSWEEDEWRPAARSRQPELNIYNNRDIRGLAAVIQAQWGNVLSGGIEALTLLEAESPITWTDTDGDGYFETGTVTSIVPEGTLSCEIEVFYPDHEGDPGYEIRPAQASVIGTTATVVFRRELCVTEIILEALTPTVATATDDGDFLTSVDVYRHWNNPATQATLMWAPGSGCGDCGGNGCANCQYTVQTACLHLRSTPRSGLLGWSPGTWNAEIYGFDAADVATGYAPDIVRIWYYAGLTPKRGCQKNMDENWKRAVTYLSMTLMDRPLCDCSANTWEYWRQDIGVDTIGDTQRYNASNTPFGSRRGAAYAWARVNDPDVARTRATTIV